MIARTIAHKVLELAGKFPVVSITGPRQSGKTTLAKALFPDYYYSNLENLEERALAEDDPKAYLSRHERGIIIDEAQNVPDLFSYLQVYSDERKRPGEFILSGSSNFLLLERISQTLAGRVAIFHLLPFSLVELQNGGFQSDHFSEHIFKGFYPRLYDYQIAPGDFYPNYIQSYVERDVRQIVNVGDLRTFRLFLQICAGRAGQIFNQSAIGNEIGVDGKTVKRWFSILETSFIAFALPPYYRNYNKRLLKTPKLYFYDTGLACSLLGIRSPEELNLHFQKGALFENFVIVEVMKQFYHQGRQPHLYYWRDQTGNELDLLVDIGIEHHALEIKSGETLHASFWKGLEFYQKVSGLTSDNTYLIYGGEQNYDRTNFKIRSWQNIPDFAKK